MAKDEGDLRCRQPKIDRHRDQAGARQRDVDFKPFDAVVGKNSNTLTLAQSQADKSRSQPSGTFVPEGIAERALRVASADFLGLQPGMRCDRAGDGEKLLHRLGLLYDILNSEYNNTKST